MCLWILRVEFGSKFLRASSCAGGGLDLASIVEFFLPLKFVSSPMGKFGLYNGGTDTAVFVPDSSTIFEYFPEHGVEILSIGNGFCVRSLGCFWFHFGMLKKNVLMQGKLNEDYISLKKYLASNKKDLYPKVKLSTIYKADFIHHFGNLKWCFEKDRSYIQEFFSDYQ